MKARVRKEIRIVSCRRYPIFKHVYKSVVTRQVNGHREIPFYFVRFAISKLRLPLKPDPKLTDCAQM